MLVDTAKVVCASVYLEHTALAIPSPIAPGRIVLLHLNPLSFQWYLRVSPLPPVLTTHLLDTIWTQLPCDVVRRLSETELGNLDVFGLSPGGGWDPLRSEGLHIVDSVIAGIGKELSNQVEANVVSNVGGRCEGKHVSVAMVSRVRGRV